MGMDFKHWFDQAEKLPFRIADLRSVSEREDAAEYFQDLEKAARCLVAGAYIDPDPKLREAGVCCIRVGTVHFAEMVSALQSLTQFSEYLRAPVADPEADKPSENSTTNWTDDLEKGVWTDQMERYVAHRIRRTRPAELLDLVELLMNGELHYEDFDSTLMLMKRAEVRVLRAEKDAQKVCTAGVPAETNLALAENSPGPAVQSSGEEAS